VLLVVEVGVWRDVEIVGVGDVLRGLFARALVWAMSILIAMALAHAMPMAARLRWQPLERNFDPWVVGICKRDDTLGHCLQRERALEISNEAKP